MLNTVGPDGVSTLLFPLLMASAQIIPDTFLSGAIYCAP